MYEERDKIFDIEKTVFPSNNQSALSRRLCRLNKKDIAPRSTLAVIDNHMLPQARLTAARGDSPISYNSFADSDDPQQDTPLKLSQEPKARPRSHDSTKVEESEEELEEDDGSDVDAFPVPETDAASISFGALARAQALLSHADGKPREGPSLRAISTQSTARSTILDSSSAENPKTRSGQKEYKRLSKHAPTEISSKKAVSRKRPVVPVPKRDVRDPRFENAMGPINEQKIKSNYAFLEEYRETEMKALRAKLKITRNDVEKEHLKKDIMRMESRKGAQDRKVAEQEILRRHRKDERAKIELGKAPFYLKRAQVKKEALIEKHGRMKPKEVDRLIERRQKKRASREKKNMPWERRVGAT